MDGEDYLKAGASGNQKSKIKHQKSFPGASGLRFHEMFWILAIIENFCWRGSFLGVFEAGFCTGTHIDVV
jgi:hypothetical protein